VMSIRISTGKEKIFSLLLQFMCYFYFIILL
jgi:hypothetical protein